MTAITRCKPLPTPDNLVDAVLASGSMPVYMHPVQHELSGQTHNLYDGGMLDYHPVPDLFWEKDDGLTLYPHFYDHIKLRWFDKFYPKRRANAALLDRTILIAPAAAFVRALPNQRIPSRQDFRHYKNDPETRTQNWLEVVKRSEGAWRGLLKKLSHQIISQIMLIFCHKNRTS